MNMIGNASHRQRHHSVLAGDAADIRVKTLAHSIPDQRLSSCGAEHDVNQAADVAVSHNLQPSLTGLCLITTEFDPALACWATLKRPFGTPYGDKLVERLS